MKTLSYLSGGSRTASASSKPGLVVRDDGIDAVRQAIAVLSHLRPISPNTIENIPCTIASQDPVSTIQVLKTMV